MVNSSSHSCEDQQHYNCHHSDARLITYEDSVDWSFGHIAHPLYSAQWSGSTNFENRFWIKDSYYLAAEDDTVHKVGATTGWTTGLITDACTDQLSEGVWKICQVEVAAGSTSGGTTPFTYLWENDTHDVSHTDSYEGGMLPGGSRASFSDSR